MLNLVVVIDVVSDFYVFEFFLGRVEFLRSCFRVLVEVLFLYRSFVLKMRLDMSFIFGSLKM